MYIMACELYKSISVDNCYNMIICIYYNITSISQQSLFEGMRKVI